MSKTAELDAELAELRQCGERIIDIADYLRNLFSGAEQGKETHNAAPVKPTIESIREIMKGFAGKGYSDEMKDILKNHGADTLKSLSPDEYAGVMQELEVFANAT